MFCDSVYFISLYYLLSCAFCDPISLWAWFFKSLIFCGHVSCVKMIPWFYSLALSICLEIGLPTFQVKLFFLCFENAFVSPYHFWSCSLVSLSFVIKLCLILFFLWSRVFMVFCDPVTFVSLCFLLSCIFVILLLLRFLILCLLWSCVLFVHIASIL